MSDRRSKGNWLLLDPPSGSGYARRASLREKEDALVAPFPSIDLVLLSGAVKRSGFDPLYIDAQIRRWDWNKLYLKSPGFEVNGVISLVSAGRIDGELSHLQRLKQCLGGVPVYLVAPIPMALDAARCRAVMEQHPWLDGLILNSAENDVAELLRSPMDAPRNVVVRCGAGVHTPSVSVTYQEDLRLPMPVHAVFKDSRYFFPQSKRTPVTTVQMSFGCPFRCEFCLDNALYRKMAYRHVDDVVEELLEIERLGFREVYFKDLTFGLNKRVTVSFLEKLASHRLRLRWLCTTRMDVATKPLLGLMTRAGCYGIEFGVESGLRHRREQNGKPISDRRIVEVFNNCHELGIETTALVMIGFEDETEDEIRRTMRFMESLGPNYVSYNVVNALPGTPLERRARAEGFLRHDVTDHSFGKSNLKLRHLTHDRLQSLRKEAVRTFYRRPGNALGRLLNVKSLFEIRKLVRLGRVAP